MWSMPVSLLKMKSCWVSWGPNLMNWHLYKKRETWTQTHREDSHVTSEERLE